MSLYFQGHSKPKGPPSVSCIQERVAGSVPIGINANRQGSDSEMCSVFGGWGQSAGVCCLFIGKPPLDD